MATSVKDVFSQSDSLGLSADWLLLYGAPEVVDHAVFVANGSPTFDQVIALYNTPLDADELRVTLRADLASPAAANGVQLYARSEALPVGDSYVLDKAYYLEVTATSATIYSLIASSVLPVQVATVALELDDNATHVISFRLRENARGTQLEAFIDSEVVPCLSAIDYANTRPAGTYSGFGILDTGASQTVSVTEFMAYVLRSAVVKPVRPPVRLLTFADIVYQAKYRLDRSGNSQFDDGIMEDYVNFALDEIYNELTPWSWAFRMLTIEVPASTRYIELPPYVALLYDVTESSLGYQLGAVNPQDLNRSDPLRNLTGTATRFTCKGMGDLGGLVMELNPIPTDAQSFTIQYYARPTPMEDDTDIPLIPSQWLEVLVYGALKRGAQYDTDQRMYTNTVASWERMVNRMKRQNYTDLKAIPRFRTANNLMRQKAYNGIGPVTRAQQLGL